MKSRKLKYTTLILLTILSISNCSIPQRRIDVNRFAGEKNTSGIVGFSLFLYMNEKVYYYPTVALELKNIKSIDYTAKKIEYYGKIDFGDIKSHDEGMYEIIQSRVSDFPIDSAFMAISGEERKDQFTISSLPIQTRELGAFVGNVNLDPFEFSKAIDLKPERNRIKYAGVILVKVDLINPKKEGRTTTYETKVTVSRGEEFLADFIKNHSLSAVGLESKYFGSEGMTAKGAEIHFLNEFVKRQKEGYWAEKALELIKQKKNQ
ncbi:hypothetical protein [Leptospira licerasiae]|nr:hypothetical protein [Leptospira licerasiae]